MILHTQYNYSTTLIISLHIYLSLIGVEFGIRAYPQDNCHTFVKLNSCRLTQIAVALALLLWGLWTFISAGQVPLSGLPFNSGYVLCTLL
jgi:hypothetical protein